MTKSGDDLYPPPMLSEDTTGDSALELGSVVASLIPVLGGPVSSVLSGWSTQRKFDRVKETLLGLAARLQNLQDRVREDYVRTDEFENLLDQTLRRVANERHTEKRRVYRELLVGAMTSTATSYDESLRSLRVLDQLQPAHFPVLRTMASSHDPTLPGLLHRLPELPRDLVVDLIDQLTALGVVKISPGGGTATITPFGHRFLNFIRPAETTGSFRESACPEIWPQCSRH